MGVKNLVITTGYLQIPVPKYIHAIPRTKQ